MAVKHFCCDPELDHEITRQVLRLDFAALLPPQAEESGLVVSHDDASVRAADEMAAVSAIPSFSWGI
jgi:hypothetical protein